MIQKARVVSTGKRTGMFLAENASGSTMVLELMRGEMAAPGEILSGSFDERKSQLLYNETRDESLRVFIHERACSLTEALEKYGNPQSARPMWRGLRDSADAPLPC